MSQQEADPSRYTRTLVVKPALNQMYDQVEVPRNGMQKTTALIRRRPVTCVYLDLGISQTVKDSSQVDRTGGSRPRLAATSSPVQEKI